MPVAHDAIVALFRQQPLLAVDLLREALGVVLPDFARATLATETVLQLDPRPLSADVVVRLGHPEQSERAVLAIVVEVQLGIDREKPRAWPSYVVGIHRTLGCPVRLLVVAIEERVARWAATPIAIGPPGFVLTPEVAGPGGVPRIVEPAAAARAPHLAVLSAVAHGRGADAFPVVRAALEGMARFDEETHTLCWELIWGAMDAAARGALKEAVMSAETKVRGYFRPVWREAFPELLEAEERRGIEKGIEKGIELGRLEEARRALRSVIDARGLTLGEAERVRIEGCDDASTLEAWLRRAVVAADLDGVLGE
jgi:hypothetical protein